jgi:hypothetical protein
MDTGDSAVLPDPSKSPAPGAEAATHAGDSAVLPIDAPARMAGPTASGDNSPAAKFSVAELQHDMGVLLKERDGLWLAAESLVEATGQAVPRDMTEVWRTVERIRDNPGTYGSKASAAADNYIKERVDNRHRREVVESALEKAEEEERLQRRAAAKEASEAKKKKTSGGGESNGGGHDTPGGGDGKGGGGGADGGGEGSTRGAQAMQDEAAKFQAKAQQAKAEVDAFAKTQPSAETAKKIGEAKTASLAEQKGLAQEGEALAEKMFTAGGAELQKAFGASNGKQMLEIARKGPPPRGVGGPLVGAVMTLATAYYVVESIGYVLEADTKLEKLNRAIEVGANFAGSAAEMALLEAVLGSAPLALVAVGLDGDGAGRPTPEQEAAQRAAEAASKDRKRLEMTVAEYLQEQFPGSVEVVEGDIKIHNRTLWDETMKQVVVMAQQHQVAANAAAKAAKMKHAHNLGVQDGLAGERNQKDDAVPQARTGAGVPYELELNTAYESGYKEGDALAEKAKQRARAAGAADRKAGKAALADTVTHYPEWEFMNQRLTFAYMNGYASN